jgi:SAM-dependent methyltransferase
MTPLPRLVDRPLLLARRRRAIRRGLETFLLDRIADEIDERLGEVNRRFTRIALVSGFPAYWSARFPQARVVPDDAVLDLAERDHDLVIHAVSLHWADDPVGQIVQCRRALSPDGLFIGVTFGGRSLNELRSVLAETEAALSGGLSPRVVPMAEIRDLGAVLQRAGLALPVADSEARQVKYRDLAGLFRDLRGMGETNVLAARNPAALSRRFRDEAARRYASAFADAEGLLPATVETIWLTGWAPAPGQQKPLRPGSAAARLADALNAAEVPLQGGPDSAGD